MLSVGRLKADSAYMYIIGFNKFFIQCILCIKIGELGNAKASIKILPSNTDYQYSRSFLIHLFIYSIIWVELFETIY